MADIDPGTVAHFRAQLDRLVTAAEKLAGLAGAARQQQQGQQEPGPGGAPVASAGGGPEGGPGGFRQQLRDLSRGFRDVRRNAADFARSLVPLPSSFGQLVRQSLQGTNVLSTLEKSFQLVMLQLGGHFVPAIVAVIEKLQDFAGWLGKAQEEGGLFGPGTIPGQGARAVGSGLDYFTGGKGFFSGRGPREWADEAVGREGLFRRQREAQTRAASELVVKQAQGGELGKQLQQYFRDLSKNKEMWMTGRFSQMPPEVQQMLTERKKAGAFKEYEGILDELYGASRKGRGRSRTGLDGSGRILLDNPPGYQAQYNAIEDIRRQAQLKALGTSPLDMELLKQAQNIYRLMQQEAAKRQASTSPIPPRGMR